MAEEHECDRRAGQRRSVASCARCARWGYCATNGAVINVGRPFDYLARNYLACKHKEKPQ
jgi:hypothetical protein